MNERVSTFLLARDKLISELHSRQARFTNSAFISPTVNKEKNRISKICISKQTR